ncbi:MAG: rhomboid family intramembrane serine protease [Deltaproteobacteria bacterium]|nr:rhomboid family intramembrane serine protease [Deltaproteobacteria bacterium]
MIPIRDQLQSRHYPIVNMALIIINVGLFLLQLTQTNNIEAFIFTYGLVPARYSSPEISSHFTLFEQTIPLISFMFLHGSFWHLLGNMWSLYIFGDNVEDHFGSFKYLVFYLLCGWVSALTHLYFNWESQIPTIGASGAIAGVMGAYLLLYPRSRILTFIPIFFIPYFIEVPALFFLGIWFVFQFLYASVSDSQMGGVAWWAHIGGFLAGMALTKLISFIPDFGLSERMSHERTKTPRLQVVRPAPPTEDLDLHGSIAITPREATSGVKKMITIIRDRARKLINVTIPPGVKAGTRLRLAGMGRKGGEREQGDFFLEILIRGD